jgi:hypothetical protein
MLGLKITTSGELVELDSLSLSVLQESVGGYIQAVDIDNETTMWVNEEGKLNQLPHNPIAQIFWNATYGQGTDYIVGDIVLTGGADENGETLPLSPESLAKAQALILTA